MKRSGSALSPCKAEEEQEEEEYAPRAEGPRGWRWCVAPPPAALAPFLKRDDLFALLFVSRSFSRAYARHERRRNRIHDFDALQRRQPDPQWDADVLAIRWELPPFDSSHEASATATLLDDDARLARFPCAVSLTYARRGGVGGVTAHVLNLPRALQVLRVFHPCMTFPRLGTFSNLTRLESPSSSWAFGRSLEDCASLRDLTLHCSPTFELRPGFLPRALEALKLWDYTGHFVKGALPAALTALTLVAGARQVEIDCEILAPALLRLDIFPCFVHFAAPKFAETLQMINMPFIRALPSAAQFPNLTELVAQNLGAWAERLADPGHAMPARLRKAAFHFDDDRVIDESLWRNLWETLRSSRCLREVLVYGKPQQNAHLVLERLPASLQALRVRTEWGAVKFALSEPHPALTALEGDFLVCGEVSSLAQLFPNLRALKLSRAVIQWDAQWACACHSLESLDFGDVNLSAILGSLTLPPRLRKLGIGTHTLTGSLPRLPASLAVLQVNKKSIFELDAQLRGRSWYSKPANRPQMHKLRFY